MASRGEGSVNLAEALTVLLQTWNAAYYRYRRPTARHFESIEALLARHELWLRSVCSRSIEEFASTDRDAIEQAFTDFENVLGPVGAAVSLHLLAPRFLPLWDRAIAAYYGLAFGVTGTNGRRYLRLVERVRDQCARLGGEAALGRNIIKAIDDNYCHFTKGWC